jgi:taurine dioxygenase
LLQKDVLRLSNLHYHGVQRVGPQWHHDGAFERRPFSLVAFQPQIMPRTGGGTEFADVAATYSSLSSDLQQKLLHLASVNAYSGAVHPLVHTHPISGRRVLFLHLAMTGAIIRWPTSHKIEINSTFEKLEAMEPSIGPDARIHQALEQEEVQELFREINQQLSQHSTTYTYNAGVDGRDILLLDNLAVAHRATPEAHDEQREVRVVHRTTLKGSAKLDPPAASGLPPFVYIWGQNPLGGLWQSSDHWGVGFRWDSTLPMFN